MDRSSIFNTWIGTKIVLTPKVTKRKDSVTVEVYYNDKQYRYTAYKEDMFGSADMYTVAHSRLLSSLREIDKNIELKYIY